MAEEASVLADLALFEGCSPEDLEHLASAVAAVHPVPEGSVVCREGEIADRWWIVVDGLAEVTVDGLYVATIGPGESIGELALLDAQPRSATVTASTDMVVHEVDGALFLELLANHPRITLALLRQVAVRLRITSVQSARPAWSEPAPRLAPSRTRPAVTDVTFNPFAPGFFSNPYEQYGLLREFDPVHRDRLTGAFVVTRFADVRRLARDRSMSVATDGATPSPAIQAEIARDSAGGGSIPRMMLRRDGADHSRLRHLVAKAFTPKAIAAWRQRAEAVVDQLLSVLGDRTVIDVIEDFAAVFPAQIISDMLGMPATDLPRVRSWSQALTKAFDPLNSPHEEAASIEANHCLAEYLERIVTAKRNHPGEDILSSLIAAEQHGDQLSHDELVAQVMLLYVAGYETRSTSSETAWSICSGSQLNSINCATIRRSMQTPSRRSSDSTPPSSSRGGSPWTCSRFTGSSFQVVRFSSWGWERQIAIPTSGASPPICSNWPDRGLTSMPRSAAGPITASARPWPAWRPR